MAEMDQAERERRLSKAYNTASQTLREAHRAEFNELYSKFAEKEGVHWEPRLKPEEKAEQQLLLIFDEFPELRERYAPSPGEDEPVPEAVPKS